MAKSLTERIAARAVKKKPVRGARNRAVFLALRDEVKEALDDGWPIKSIWETLHEEGKVDFSYQAFRGYANRLLLAPSKPERSIPVAESQRDTSRPAMKSTAAKQPVEQPRKAAGFTFDSNPKKEDLL